MHDIDAHISQSRYMAGNLRQGLMGQHIVDMLGMEMARHGFIARQLSERIPVGKFLNGIYYSTVLLGAKQHKEVEPLVGLWRGIEPWHVSSIAQQIVADPEPVFGDHSPVVAAVPGVFEI